jgi:hypothetical protein
MQQHIGFEGAANPMTVFNVGSRPAGMYFVGCIDTQQQACAEQSDQCRRFKLVQRGFDEQCNLLR